MAENNQVAILSSAPGRGDRAIGCGQAWPKSLGVSHVDEHGAVSEALSQVFLPYRAELLTMFLQACRPEALVSALGVYAYMPADPLVP